MENSELYLNNPENPDNLIEFDFDFDLFSPEELLALENTDDLEKITDSYHDDSSFSETSSTANNNEIRIEKDNEKQTAVKRKSSMKKAALKKFKLAKLSQIQQFDALKSRVKTDVRRDYLNMFLNIYNGCDENLLLRFSYSYLAPNAVAINRNPEILSEDFKLSGKIPMIQGLPRIFENWRRDMLFCPDFTFRAHNMKFILRSDGTAKIITFLQFNGTMVVSNTVEEEERDENNTLVIKKSLKTDLIPIEMKGNYIIHLNKENKMFFIENFIQ